MTIFDLPSDDQLTAMKAFLKKISVGDYLFINHVTLDGVLLYSEQGFIIEIRPDYLDIGRLWVVIFAEGRRKNVVLTDHDIQYTHALRFSDAY